MNTAEVAAGSLVRLLAGTGDFAAILAGLHARATAASGAQRTVLLEFEAGTRRATATSATGFQDLPGGTWLTDAPGLGVVGVVLEGGRAAAFQPLRDASPELARRLETPAAILAPVVTGGEPLGLLVLGCHRLPSAPAWTDAVMECADAFGLAISRARMERDRAVHREMHALVVALGREAAPELPAGHLNEFCQAVAGLFAADTVRLWVHEREARRLTLLAGSESGRHAREMVVPVADASHPAATAMRAPRAVLLAPPPDGDAARLATAAVPLSARRRAIGTLVLERVRIAPGDEAWTLQRLDDLGRHLANLLEGAQLIGEVVRTKGELQDTFDSMQDLVFVYTRNGRVTYANRAASGRLNRRSDVLVSHQVTEFMGDHLARWLAEDGSERPPRPHPRSAELQDPVLGGIFRVTVTPLFTSDRAWAGSVMVAHDVSEERRVEAERADLRERLAQSETLSQLVAGIAHELNNPLQGVLGHVELLRRTERLSPKASAAIRQVFRESDRAARIVRNLLLLAGSGHVVRRPVSVNAAARRALALRAAACRRAGITIERHIEEHLPRVAGDALLIQQAIHNVIMNAEQAMPAGGGRIEIRTSLARKRRQVVVEIRDSGHGIPPDALPRIFDPFFTTRDAGSGLGLAIARRIVREHDGDIEAANHPGGARFTLRFPAARMVK